MKTLIMCLYILTIGFGTQAQKPALDTSAFRTWESTGGGAISPDGKFICYFMNHGETGNHIMVVRSTKDEWERRFTAAGMPKFAIDSKNIVFKIGQDSLCILMLGGKEMEIIPNVSDFRLTGDRLKSWLAYRLADSLNEIILRPLNKGIEFRASAVKDFVFPEHSSYLIISTYNGNEEERKYSVKSIDFNGFVVRTIWSSREINETPGKYAFDTAGKQIVFLAEMKDNNPSYSIWYFRVGGNAAVLLADDHTEGLNSDMKIGNFPPSFTDRSNSILFKIQSKLTPPPKMYPVGVDVWSYMDTKLQSVQLNEVNASPAYSVITEPGSNKAIRLEYENERILALHGNYALVMHQAANSDIFESPWNPLAKYSYYLVYLKNGTRVLIRKGLVINDLFAELSPDGKWVVYYDVKKRNYFSYEIATGITRNITRGISTLWTKKDAETTDAVLERGLKWLPSEEALFIKDNFDIWKISLTGIHRPMNITKGYGAKHSIKFEFSDKPSNQLARMQGFYLILRAMNTLSKDMGFYEARVDQLRNPELLTMGPYVYGFWSGIPFPVYPPEKAEEDNIWLVARMSATESPNYFVTRDFKSFVRMSDVNPERAYNWMTTSLTRWKSRDGVTNTGILYKPENFSASKNYPVIFDFYETRSDELNLYIRPNFSTGRINIPWFVSRGYLVYVPDIHYKIGQPGNSALQSVVLAALHMKAMPWVKGNALGIEGHSFGGYEVNYIVTHTGLFAAACAASGESDLVSLYGSDVNGGYVQYHAEHQQGRMGCAPWQIPELYVKNSPIFSADKVSTPLLLVNNKGDKAVPISQGIEFFTSLRRLGKAVWMLQYDHSGHIVYPEDAPDFTIRLTQFFDHYLMGVSAPVWMAKGIPAKMKGRDSGLEIDLDSKK